MPRPTSDQPVDVDAINAAFDRFMRARDAVIETERNYRTIKEALTEPPRAQTPRTPEEHNRILEARRQYAAAIDTALAPHMRAKEHANKLKRALIDVLPYDTVMILEDQKDGHRYVVLPYNDGSGFSRFYDEAKGEVHQLPHTHF